MQAAPEAQTLQQILRGSLMADLSGILIKAIAGFYYIEAGDGIYECKARGKFRKNNISPTVGDRLAFEDLGNGKGIVNNILPRKNLLIRPPVANLDRLFIVSSHNTPSPNALIIDRLTAIAIENKIEPIIVFNKSDLGDMSQWVEIYKKSGFKTISASGLSGEGCDEIFNLLKDKVSAFTGNSGVGKSSILNKLMPELSLDVGDVSEKLGRGRHTTRHTELFKVGGGYVADTPGFSSLDIEKTMLLEKENLQFNFPEFANYLGKCKFSSCTHTVEKGCQIINAVNSGEISKSRFESYRSIYNELKAINKW